VLQILSLASIQRVLAEAAPILQLEMQTVAGAQRSADEMGSKLTSVLRLTIDYISLMKGMYRHWRKSAPYIQDDHLVCYRCRQPIQLGERFVRHRSSPYCTHFYHYRCARQVNLV